MANRGKSNPINWNTGVATFVCLHVLPVVHVFSLETVADGIGCNMIITFGMAVWY